MARWGSLGDGGGRVKERWRDGVMEELESISAYGMT